MSERDPEFWKEVDNDVAEVTKKVRKYWQSADCDETLDAGVILDALETVNVLLFYQLKIAYYSKRVRELASAKEKVGV